MGLFEILRQKQVRITPEAQVTVEYIKANRLSDVLNSLDGDVLFIKHSISQNDANWLKSYRGNCMVFTTHPDTMATFNVSNELMKKLTVNYLKSIGLNYIHCRDVLYVFADSIDVEPALEIPNMLRIYPVRRNDIGTQISVDIGALDATIGIGDKSNEQNDSQNSELSDQSNPINNIDNNPPAEKQFPTEIDWVRMELKKLFDERYTVVKVELKGVLIERKTISLSAFYNKHNIAKGRLKGSWNLFEKKELKNILDEGIARKAMDMVNQKFTINIDGYGRIVCLEKKDEFLKAMNQIKADYISYRRGKNGCKKIGEIEIKTEFKPEEAIRASCSELQNYLIGVCPVKGPEAERYMNEVKYFADASKWISVVFASKVELTSILTTYTDDQWQDDSFVKKVWRTCKSNREYFEYDFAELLHRYIRLLDESEKSKKSTA